MHLSPLIMNLAPGIPSLLPGVATYKIVILIDEEKIYSS